MSKLTKEQAEQLLDAYVREQTAAVEAAIAAYEQKLAAQLEEQEQDLAQQAAKTLASAAAQYDKNAVNALIRRRTLDEQIARRGLSRSGSGLLARQGVTAAAAHTRAQIAGETRGALGDIEQKLLSARKTVAAKSADHAASARRSLADKTAQKRLTLMKGVSV